MQHEAHLVVTKPLDAAEGGAAPNSHPPGVHSGDVAAFRRPLHKAFCPEAAFVNLQRSRGDQTVALAAQQRAADQRTCSTAEGLRLKALQHSKRPQTKEHAQEQRPSD